MLILTHGDDDEGLKRMCRDEMIMMMDHEMRMMMLMKWFQK